MDGFSSFFSKACATEAEPDGYEPHGYQARIARDGLPSGVEAPTIAPPRELSAPGRIF